MTTEELKAHRRAICEALIEGKQCQVLVYGNWVDQHTQTVACRLFNEPSISEAIRIKPEPRKVWIGWRGPECFPILAETEESFRYMSNKYPHFNWQLVEEQV